MQTGQLAQGFTVQRPFGCMLMRTLMKTLVEQVEYLVLSPKLHLQHVGTCRAQKNRVFGPFYQWFFKTNHSSCDAGQAPILSKTTWYVTHDG